MHELSLIIDVVEKVDAIAREKGIAQISKVTLEVGEAFSVIPMMMKSVYKRTIPGTRLEGSVLELEIIPARAVCSTCGAEFNPLVSDGVCTECGESDYKVLSGKEFIIKDMTVPQTS